MRYFIAVRHLKERASRNRGLTDSRGSGSQQRLPRRVPPPPPRLLRPSVAIKFAPIRGRGGDRDKGPGPRSRRRGRGRTIGISGTTETKVQTPHLFGFLFLLTVHSHFPRGATCVKQFVLMALYFLAFWTAAHPLGSV